jgi:glycosyltransferase involved in cell wall biosynthesis
MKIGIDVSQIVYPGGVGVYTRNLISHLLKIDSVNGYVFCGFSLRNYQKLEEWFAQIKRLNARSKFVYLPPTLTQILFNQLRWPRLEFFSGKIDLFHTSDWTEPRADCPKITTVHDLAPLIYPQFHHPQIVAVFKRKLDLVKKESAKIIAVSQNTKKDLIKKLGIEERRIEVIYEALDEKFKQAKPDLTIIKKYNLKQFIISDAIKNPRKNLKNLLIGFEKIKDKELKLVLVGQPMWQKGKMLSLINQSRTRKRILNLSFVAQSQLKALYQRAKGAVFPSFYEGFGLPILEAMTCGCPVICSKVSSLPEVGGRAAILVHPQNDEEIAEAIKKIITNESLRNKLIKQGFKQVKKFSWEKAAQQTLKVYQEALK